jgi:hypothetical protein
MKTTLPLLANTTLNVFIKGPAELLFSMTSEQLSFVANFFLLLFVTKIRPWTESGPCRRSLASSSDFYPRGKGKVQRNSFLRKRAFEATTLKVLDVKKLRYTGQYAGRSFAWSFPFLFHSVPWPQVWGNKFTELSLEDRKEKKGSGKRELLKWTNYKFGRFVA